MNGLAKVTFTIDGHKFYERRFKRPSRKTRKLQKAHRKSIVPVSEDTVVVTGYGVKLDYSYSRGLSLTGNTRWRAIRKAEYHAR